MYAEFDGLDAHRDAWRRTAAYRVLNETTTGAMLEQTLSRLLDQLMAGGANMPATGPELTGLGEHLLRSGLRGGDRSRAGGRRACRSGHSVWSSAAGRRDSPKGSSTASFAAARGRGPR